MKKRWLAVLALLALVLGLALLGTVPVYPAFQKGLSSMDELQKALRQEALLTQCRLMIDSAADT